MGDNDITRQFDSGAGRRAVDVRVSAIYGYSPSTQWFSGSTPRPADTPAYRMDLHLVTFVANAEHRSGAGLGLTLPYGAIFRRDRDPKGDFDSILQTYDVGPGDLEMRLRQDVTRWFTLSGKYWPRLVISAGAVAPTGPYVPKQTTVGGDQVALASQDRYASLGRGVWWLLLDAELYGTIAENLGWYAALYTRTSVNDAINGFAWGPERRVGGGASWRFWPGVLSASLGVDWQWRGLSSELVYSPLAGKVLRQTYVSGGGDWVDLTPTLRAEIVKGLAATATLRLPLYRNVEGTQGVQDFGVFVGAQYSFGFGEVARPAAPGPLAPGAVSPGPLVTAALTPNRWTLLDYWATWCAPCQQLTPKVEEFARQRPDIVVQRVDVSEWGQAEMDRYLPGLPGIPVIDLWTPDGHLAKRLFGPECAQFQADLPLPATPTQHVP